MRGITIGDTINSQQVNNQEYTKRERSKSGFSSGAGNWRETKGVDNQRVTNQTHFQWLDFAAEGLLAEGKLAGRLFLFARRRGSVARSHGTRIRRAAKGAAAVFHTFRGKDPGLFPHDMATKGMTTPKYTLRV